MCIFDQLSNVQLMFEPIGPVSCQTNAGSKVGCTFPGFPRQCVYEVQIDNRYICFNCSYLTLSGNLIISVFVLYV